MANWCWTNIHIEHHDQKQLEALYDLFEQWTSKDFCEHQWVTTNWLGNIVGNSGIGDPRESTYYCRGKLEQIDIMPGQLNLATETAWEASLQMFKAIVDTYLPDANIVFFVDLSDEGFYATNDPNYEGLWLVENIGCDEFDCEEREDVPEDILIKKLKKLLHTRTNDIDKLLDKFENSDYTDDIYLHKWDVMNIDEFN